MGNIYATRRWLGARTALLTLLMAVSAPKAGAESFERTDTVSSTLSDNDRSRYQYFYLEALSQQQKGNLAAAFDLYRHALAINRNAAEVYDKLAELYSTLDQDKKACEYREEAVRLDPTNSKYLESMAEQYFDKYDFVGAAKYSERIYENDKSRSDVLWRLCYMYYFLSEFDKALDALNRLELSEGSSSETIGLRLRIYDMLDDTARAKSFLTDLVAKNPHNSEYKILFSSWLLDHQQMKKALQLCKEVLAEDPRNVDAKTQLLDYYATTGCKDKHDSLLREMLRSEDTPEDVRYRLVSVAISQLGDTPDTAKVMQICSDALSVRQKNFDILMLKAAQMEAGGYPADSVIAAYKEALAVNPGDEEAQGSYFQALFKEKRYDDVIASCQSLLQDAPEQVLLYYFEAFAKYYQEKNDDALTLFQKVVTTQEENANPAILSDAYMLMGEIYREKKMPKECYAAYENCLKVTEDNIPAMNNYAYYLSLDKDGDLQKAEKLSRKTVQEEPQNVTYLDTYAWVLFKEKRYADAKSVMERVLQSDSTISADMTEHAGDIFYMAGEEEKAMELWQKSAQMKSPSATLQRKIELRKYIEE